MRLRWKVLGGHVHCRLFTAKAADQTFAKNGDLVFSVVEEWPVVKARAERCGIELIEDEPPQ